MTKLTRRQALKTGAAAIAAGTVATSPALAALGTQSAAQPDCATLHKLMGQNLAMYCDDATVSAQAKTMAIKTSHCPHCQVGIAPFGDSVGFVRL